MLIFGLGGSTQGWVGSFYHSNISPCSIHLWETTTPYHLTASVGIWTSINACTYLEKRNKSPQRVEEDRGLWSRITYRGGASPAAHNLDGSGHDGVSPHGLGGGGTSASCNRDRCTQPTKDDIEHNCSDTLTELNFTMGYSRKVLKVEVNVLEVPLSISIFLFFCHVIAQLARLTPALMLGGRSYRHRSGAVVAKHYTHLSY